MKRNILAFLALIFILNNNYDIFATSYNTISTVTRLNLTKGRVNGEKVDYILYLPSLWANSLTAEREKVNDKGPIIEKIIFYYIPEEKNVKPVFFMNFYLYDKRMFKETNNIIKLLETDDYVFAIEGSSQNNLTNKTDNAIYERLLVELTDSEYIANFFRLPSNQRIIVSNTVSVNGKKLKGRSVNLDGTVYVPIREVCEELGYKINWLENDEAVSIAKNNFYYLLFLNPPSYYPNYKVTVINGKAYAPTIFYVQRLNVNIEIDENYCVYFNS